MKILFILKDRLYNKSSSKSYGLINSANQVANYLESLGNDCKVVQVIDSNFIDKEIHEYRPSVVIIEALWVSKEKLKELMRIYRHKHIKWIIRVHSDIGFLSTETLGIKYINDYLELDDKDNLFIVCNNEEFTTRLSSVLKNKLIYLPNIISILFEKPKQDFKSHIDIGCFGALRILKNQCYQAMCAIEAANILKKPLRFHISVDANIDDENRVSNPVLRNLEELFKNSPHKLVKHGWLDNDKFHELIEDMDIGLQLSFTESFNIVTADFTNLGIPIVVSKAISWMPNIFKTSTVNYRESIDKIVYIYKNRHNKKLIISARKNLLLYNLKAQREWKSFIDQLHSEHCNHDI